jgi:pimeloyl-ACP methyl ester carboxylesterase
MTTAVEVGRTALRVLQAASPRAAGALADRMFCTPPRWRPTPAHHAFLATGESFTVRSEGSRVAAWRWGSGPTVALVHGWGSRGMRFRTMVQALAQRGFTAVVFDAPGHGASDGQTSSMVQFAWALTAVADHVGPLHAVVGHSLGGAATALALRQGVEVERAVFIATPADPGAFVDQFAAMFAMRPAALNAMRRRIARRLRTRWDALSVPAMAQEIDVPLLVVHDREDPTVPWSDGAAIAKAWGAELVTTTGLGHHAVVGHASIVGRVVEFLAEGIAVGDKAASSTAEWLERELFDRERRRRRIADRRG